MEKGLALLSTEPRVVIKADPRLRLLLELQPRHEVFFSNLADLFSRRTLAPFKGTSPPGSFWHDVFVPTRVALEVVPGVLAVAHGGHDCGLGPYAGLGLATAAACEPIVVPGVRGGLLLAVEGVSERAPQHSATNDSCEGAGRVSNTSCQGDARGCGKSWNSEAGVASRFEIGGRSADT